MWSVCEGSVLIGMDALEVFAGGIISHAAKRATPAALAVLQALGAVAPEPYGARARREADRLTKAGVAQRRWAGALGRATPTDAWLSYDPIDDDGVSVMVGFDGPGGADTVGIYIDHNLGGLAKDAFAVPASLAEVLARLRANKELAGPAYRRIPLGEVAARWREAFKMTDMTLDPPTTVDLNHLRALVLARLATLPRDGVVPAPQEIGQDERERLLTEFLESGETVGRWGPDGADAEELELLAHQVMTFSLDYVVGTPLRFSPVMVEIFCLDWAPRKIAADREAFIFLPDVLAAWIRFAGSRRGIPEGSIAEAVAAAYEHAPEMIELSQDPGTWGPAKTMALAIQRRGIDISDQAALDNFVAEVNRNGGIDVLARSLVGSVESPR